MHTPPMPLRALALLGLLSLAAACKSEPQVDTATQARAKFCKDGGAEFSAESNECVCPYAARWNGARCESEGGQPKVEQKPQTALPESMPPVEPPEATEPEGPEPAATEAEPPVAAAASVDEALKKACRQAKAHWVEADGYCHCPKDMILVGNRCRVASGSISDDACRRAVHKGKWKKGECLCAAGQVFVPARGGCVAKLPLNDKTKVPVLRRVCESTLNRGKWDAAASRCQCGPGRIWHDELCQVQQKLTSKTVCESDFNQGIWDKVAKTCTCKPGAFWINQACLSAKTVSAKVACEAEANKGSWNVGANRCICPGLTKWHPTELRCK